MRKRIAVFASGNGSNLQALIDYSSKKDINGDIVLVFSDKEGSRALKRAKKHGIKTNSLDPGRFSSRDVYEKSLIKLLKKEKIDLIVLAGYMRMLGKGFVKEYRQKIINIHPALLPCFKGMHAIGEAYEKGVKITGVTVHFVDEEMDNGPIIAQVPVFIDESDSLEVLEKKIHKTEHILYPKIVENFCNGRIKLEGKKAYIKD